MRKSISGLRARRYCNRSQKPAALYSFTVMVQTSPTPLSSKLPDELWWTACCQRQCRNGVRVINPAMKPIVWLAAFDLKKEPCPQSWKIIKTRTKNRPARAAKPRVSGQDFSTVKYKSIQIATKGPIELMICHTLFLREGIWYFATIFRQLAVFLRVEQTPGRGGFISLISFLVYKLLIKASEKDMHSGVSFLTY